MLGVSATRCQKVSACYLSQSKLEVALVARVARYKATMCRSSVTPISIINTDHKGKIKREWMRGYVATRCQKVRFAATLRRNYGVFRLGESRKGSAKINGKGRERGKERSPRVWDPGAPQPSLFAELRGPRLPRPPWTSFSNRSEATNNNHKNKWGKKMLQCTKI